MLEGQEHEQKKASRSISKVRHTFNLDLVRRDPTLEDEKRDRGRRTLSTLHYVAKTPKAAPHEPSRTYSIFRYRYPMVRGQSIEYQQHFESVEQDQSELHEEEQIVKQNALSIAKSSTVRSRLETLETSVKTWESTSASYNEANEALVKSLVEESHGRLDPKIIDVQPNMVADEPALFDAVCHDLVKEMSDTFTEVGQAVSDLSGPEKGKSRKPKAEIIYQNAFSRLCNVISQRFARASSFPGPPDTPYELFSSHGNTSTADGEPPDGYDEDPTRYRINVMIRGITGLMKENLSCSDVASFGEVKKSAAEDLKDSLLGQLLTCDRKMKENYPITGRGVFFTLCGSILRLWYTDPAKLGSSTAYDLNEPGDFLKIVHIIAFLSGPVTNILQQWEPKVGENIWVQALDEKSHEYEVLGVSLLAISVTIWGRRSTVWSLDFRPVDEDSPMPDHPDMKMIVKSTWLPDHLHKHELDVLRWLQNPGEDIRVPIDRPRNLPVAIGTVRSNLAINIDDWRTLIPTDNCRNSTIATFCFPAYPSHGMIKPRDFLRVYRGLTQVLRYVALTGVHYRDLNKGNVLRDKHGECVLIDFGHARILQRPRGQTPTTSEGNWKLSFNDYRSGTRFYMSRRAHELTDKIDNYMRVERTLVRAPGQPQLAAEDIATRQEMARRKLEQLRAQIASPRYHHRHIDDLEGAWYLVLAHAAELSGDTGLVAELYKLASIGTKREMFQEGWVDYAFRMICAMLTMWEGMFKLVGACITALEIEIKDGNLEHLHGRVHSTEDSCTSEVIQLMIAQEGKMDAAKE